ncbi:MAG: GNAT family N-acetyltransferase [Phycisphaerales bacterium JB058]
MQQGDHIKLREVVPGDLPTIYAYQLDPEANRMAVAKPRSRDDFRSHWEQSLDDPKVVARVIVADGEVVGHISCFEMDGRENVGYWVDRAHWGKGIASRGLARFLGVVERRPLHARAARSNAGSIRVLEKCGFVLTGYEWSEETERFPACEEAVFELV